MSLCGTRITYSSSPNRGESIRMALTYSDYMAGVYAGTYSFNNPPPGSYATNDPNIWETPWGATWQPPGYVRDQNESYDAWRARVYTGSPAELHSFAQYPATAWSGPGYAGNVTAARIEAGGSPTLGAGELPVSGPFAGNYTPASLPPASSFNLPTPILSSNFPTGTPVTNIPGITYSPTFIYPTAQPTGGNVTLPSPTPTGGGGGNYRITDPVDSGEDFKKYIPLAAGAFILMLLVMKK